jgi:hypothetical protein
VRSHLCTVHVCLYLCVCMHVCVFVRTLVRVHVCLCAQSHAHAHKQHSDQALGCCTALEARVPVRVCVNVLVIEYVRTGVLLNCYFVGTKD